VEVEVEVEVLVTDVPSQAILLVIVLNQIHVVIPINKVAMMNNFDNESKRYV
jgi:hypothetical protein